jgi:hypothetical protein
MRTTNTSNLTASLPTKIAYCASLLAIGLGAFLQSSWISLATGGGIFGIAGLLTTQAIFILILFRVYIVIGSPEALDARYPNPFGWILRFVGQLIMWLSVVGLASQFLIRPLTTLIFGDYRTESGAEFFIVGLFAAFASGMGWLGCVLFEISRICGKKTSPTKLSTKSKWPMPNAAVLAGIAILVAGIPYAMQKHRGEPCSGKLLDCTANVEILAQRSIVLDKTKPVYLETNLDSIIFLPQEKNRRVWKESLRKSITSLGYTVSNDTTIQEKIIVVVGQEKNTIVIQLVTKDTNGTASHIVTRMSKEAALTNSDSNLLNLEVKLPVTPQGLSESLVDTNLKDGLFAQLWPAFVSYAQDSENRVKKTLSPEMFELVVEKTEFPSDSERREFDKRTKENCAKAIHMKGSEGVKMWELNSFGNPMVKIDFISPEADRRFTYVNFWESVRCNEYGVWDLYSPYKANFFVLRQFSNEGRLLRHLQVPFAKSTNDVGGIAWGNVNPQIKDGKIELVLLKHTLRKPDKHTYLLNP